MSNQVLYWDNDEKQAYQYDEAAVISTLEAEPIEGEPSWRAKIRHLEVNGKRITVEELEVLTYKPPTANDVRRQRNYLLTEVDDVTSKPLYWGGLSTEAQQEVITYRQLLLDLPETEGFPENTVYPEVPKAILDLRPNHEDQ